MREIIDCHKTEKNNKRWGEKREEGPGPRDRGRKADGKETQKERDRGPGKTVAR